MKQEDRDFEVSLGYIVTPQVSLDHRERLVSKLTNQSTNHTCELDANITKSDFVFRLTDLTFLT